MTESDLWLMLLAFGSLGLVVVGGAGLRDWFARLHDAEHCRVCRQGDDGPMQP